MAKRTGEGITANDIRRRGIAHTARCLVPRGPRSDPQAGLLDDRDRAAGDRVQRRDALAARGPLLCFLIAPDRTPQAIERTRAWVRLHAHRVAVRGLSALGA